ncbi:gliding motility protein GldN [Belliella kenyensis]|uniref:Gliding motility protein GldN n=1 Tax=Belliella kenyensis TaxID=1472724 RepID=A0ABV8ESD1_9BACT|nr:gliding motility protein GldN [Belliella kenyensis]MCH7402550.1 gliding motility protein GldN [Belliella kenyensis]MDN3603348.1 gliding motility protein GldN [Belliella kenyensis]
MKKHAKILSLIILLGLVVQIDVMAQVPTSMNPSGSGDRQFKQDTVYSIRPIREDDKMYQIAVWRRIDLREKFNQPLYGAGDSKSNGIMSNIYKAVVEENALEVFEDEQFTKPMSIAEFQNRFWMAANGDSIFMKNLYYLDFREDFLFDKHHSQTKFDVKYLEIVMPSETNANAGQKTVAFIRFKDFYNHFTDHPEAKWINFQNASKDLGYDQAFDLRLFRSVVRKYANKDDALIVDMVSLSHPNPELQAFLDALEFEYKLLDWENSLWEW